MSYDQKKLKDYKGIFVIQRHDATNLHWDFRLSFPVTKSDLAEYENKRDFTKSNEPRPSKVKVVLRSWAIPKHKKPTSKPVLAQETEDHDIFYANFSGTIPEGQYGAGKVEIYDAGKYKIVDFEYDHKYVIQLFGEKVNGYYALIKTKGKSWLWIKVKDTDQYKKIANYLINCL